MLLPLGCPFAFASPPPVPIVHQHGLFLLATANTQQN